MSYSFVIQEYLLIANIITLFSQILLKSTAIDVDKYLKLAYATYIIGPVFGLIPFFTKFYGSSKSFVEKFDCYFIEN